MEKAKLFNIKPGPIYGALKKGETIILPDRRIFQGEEFINHIRKGRKIVFAIDTVYSENLSTFACEADLLIHDSTYSEKEKENAQRNFHSTTVIAAKVAKEAEVKQLILTHISPRYGFTSKNNRTSEKDLLIEARKIFPQTLLAEDFMEYAI